VVLGDPEAEIAEPLGLLRQIQGIAQRRGRVAAARDRGEIED
jgi:hypothetical protein